MQLNNLREHIYINMSDLISTLFIRVYKILISADK